MSWTSGPGAIFETFWAPILPCLLRNEESHVILAFVVKTSAPQFEKLAADASSPSEGDASWPELYAPTSSYSDNSSSSESKVSCWTSKKCISKASSADNKHFSTERTGVLLSAAPLKPLNVEVLANDAFKVTLHLHEKVLTKIHQQHTNSKISSWKEKQNMI